MVLTACQAVKGEIILMRRNERSVFYAAVIAVCVVLLPIVFFMMISLWPDRMSVSWLLLCFGALIVLVLLALRVMKTGTIARVRLEEERLRPGRLYANERLVESEGSYHEGWGGLKQRAVMDEPYIQGPYEYDSHRQVPVPDDRQHVSYNGSKPLSIDSYDWEEKD
jgi:hypothetical protein